MLRIHIPPSPRNSLSMHFLVHEPVNEDTCCDAEQDANADGNECEPGLGGGEGVGWPGEDVGDRGEEEEEDAEGEGGVD